MNTLSKLNPDLAPFKTVKAHNTSASLIILPLLFFALLLAFPEASRAAVDSSLQLCAQKLIPSLFPFMVAGELFFALGAGETVGRLLGKPFSRLFGISENGVSAFLLGAVCGLPLGAKYALSLYKNGEITKSDCEKLMGISTNAGIGFVVVGIGVSIYGSVRLGWLLYLCQIVASSVTGILLKGDRKTCLTKPVISQKAKNSFPALFADAVASSAVSLIKICGFVIFFGVLSAFTVSASSFFSLPTLIPATVISFTELTAACEILREISLSNSPVIHQSSRILTFFAVGFAGLSVHMQTASFALEHNVGIRKYLLTKLISGVICALLGAAVLHFLPTP